MSGKTKHVIKQRNRERTGAFVIWLPRVNEDLSTEQADRFVHKHFTSNINQKKKCG